MGLQPGGEVWEDRRRLVAAVDRALELLAAGASAAAAEIEGVDFKEEAGRRGRGGVVLSGQARSDAVASQLADEVACLANTPGGGALVVGVADDGTVIGAASDRDWLRQRVHERVEVAPAVEERLLPGGQRLLVLLVAEAREPVENIGGQLRWRVGATCAPVDRSEWWADRLRRAGVDPLAARTNRTTEDIAPGALAATRRLLRGSGEAASEVRELPARELLTRLGVLLPDGYLTAAGVHMFGPAPRTVLELAVLDVAGGDVVSAPPDLAGLSLVEQLAEIESRLDVLDKAVVLQSGLHLEPVRLLPWLAVREALLNAVVHRDWQPPEPVHVTWVEADASLDVVSPGGFAGGVTSESVLSAGYSRNPALADLARAMGLVERQGVGVDRMFRELVSLGHRPPVIREEPGPQVRTRLVGGRPLLAVVSVMSALEPPVRRRDVRVALAVHALLRDGFVAASTLGRLLQVPPEEAEEALDVAAGCTVDTRPLARLADSGMWLPGPAVVARATKDAQELARAQRRGLLTWYRPTESAAQTLVRSYLDAAGRLSSGELAEITGLTGQGALNMLTRLERNGIVARGPTERGRRAHFVAAGGGSGGFADPGR
jgi:ATP-dependent DNA helicase RecG